MKKEEALAELDEKIERQEEIIDMEVSGCPRYTGATAKKNAYKQAKKLIKQLE